MSHSAKLNTVSQSAPLAGSLAIKQLIATYEEQVAMTGSTPQLEIQLERLRAQLQTDTVGRAKVAERLATEAAAAEKKASKKFSKPAVVASQEPGKEMTCRDCNSPFFLKESQSAFFVEKGMSEPTRCFGCRQERKAARWMIPCLECETEFEFTPADQSFYQEQGWNQPKRCVSCRANKLQSQTLSCVGCKKQFNFSVASQKHFKSQSWRAPTRCFECRRNKSKEKQAAAAADYAEALQVVEAAFAEGAAAEAAAAEAVKPIEFGFALSEGPAPAIFSGSAASTQ